jgi:hypothetical protein
MSLYDYKAGLEISAQDYPFYALIQAAMRQADSTNIELLKSCWPGIWEELRARYNSPGGLLPNER